MINRCSSSSSGSGAGGGSSSSCCSSSSSSSHKCATASRRAGRGRSRPPAPRASPAVYNIALCTLDHSIL